MDPLAIYLIFPGKDYLATPLAFRRKFPQTIHLSNFSLHYNMGRLRIYQIIECRFFSFFFFFFFLLNSSLLNVFLLSYFFTISSKMNPGCAFNTLLENLSAKYPSSFLTSFSSYITVEHNSPKFSAII